MSRWRVWIVAIGMTVGGLGCNEVLGWEQSWEAGSAPSCEGDDTDACDGQRSNCCDTLIVAACAGGDCGAKASGFNLDAFEVTVGRFRTLFPTHSRVCGNLPALAQRDAKLPMTCVTAKEAEEFCKADHGRLPTPSELERAAMEWDTKNHTFPWGNEQPTPQRINAKITSINDATVLLPVGSASDGVNAFGQFDILGNAREWVDENGEFKTYGGSFNHCASYSSTSCTAQPLDQKSSRWSDPPATYDVETGFRCAREL